MTKLEEEMFQVIIAGPLHKGSLATPQELIAIAAAEVAKKYIGILMLKRYKLMNKRFVIEC